MKKNLYLRWCVPSRIDFYQRLVLLSACIPFAMVGPCGRWTLIGIFSVLHFWPAAGYDLFQVGFKRQVATCAAERGRLLCWCVGICNSGGKFRILRHAVNW